MKITCYSCDKLVTEVGALVFSPPTKTNKEVSISTVHKYHVCRACWPKLIKAIEKLEEK